MVKLNNKVILLNFPFGPECVSHAGRVYPSTAVLLIGTILKNNGYNVEIIDGGLYPNYTHHLENSLEKEKPLFVALSFMTTQVTHAVRSARIVKSIYKDVPVLAGGAHPTLFPEQTVQDENIDIVIVNEGTKTIKVLADNLKQANKDFNAVKGIVYKDADSQVIVNDPGESDDINELPFFDFSLIDVEKYLNPQVESVYQREFPNLQKKITWMPILTALGCPYSCQFCINVILKRKYRFRSAEAIINRIKFLQKIYNVDTFLFLDENFFVSKKRFFEFLDLAEKENLKFNWRVWCRVDYFKEDYINDNVLKRLSDIGHGSFVMGAESADDKTLCELKKGITSDQILKSLEFLRKTNITARYSFIVGLENENMRQIKKTYSFCMKMADMHKKVDIAGPVIFRLYPGSPIFLRLIDKYNIKIPQTLEQWSDHQLNCDSYVEMPWTPKSFKKKITAIDFYSGLAFRNELPYLKKYSLLGYILREIAKFRVRTGIYFFKLDYLIIKCILNRQKTHQKDNEPKTINSYLDAYKKLKLKIGGYVSNLNLNGKSAVYGTGDVCEIILNSQPETLFSLIIDKDPEKWGRTEQGLPIIPPSKIADYDIQNILISSYSHGKEIKQGLKRGCEDSNINLITLEL